MILLTGGSGLLGSEIRRRMICFAPNRDQLDITKSITLNNKPKLIIHCAAYTNVNEAEKNRSECYEINVLGTRNISELHIPTIYISTDGVFAGDKGMYKEDDVPYPQNYYCLTKLLGEFEIRKPNNIIVRCSFKPRPWKSNSAFKDQWTSAEYVDETASKIVKIARRYRIMPRTLHIGGKRRSQYSMAQETRKVRPVSIRDVTGVRRGRDTSLDSSLWESLGV